MTTYVWRGNGWYDKRTGEMMVLHGNAVCCPAVISDIQEYRSPIDGKLITSRSHRRYDLEKNGCVEAEPRKRKGYNNPKFALKRGLPLSEQARDSLKI